MADQSRRAFMRQSLIGAGTAALAGLSVPTFAASTPSSGDLGDFKSIIESDTPPELKDSTPKQWKATEDNILGPYHRPNAPYRAKITPPLAQGKTMLIRGRVWSMKTQQPLSGALLDIWQADHQGRYDNDDPNKPPQKHVFKYRARILTDETGYYEYETIMPGHYRIGPKTWRPAHIHYLVREPKHKQLITQLYFEGDPHNATDRFIKPSLIIPLKEAKGGTGNYQVGEFNIVLDAA